MESECLHMSPSHDSSRPSRIDIHLNLAGTGTHNSGCLVTPRFRRRFTFEGLRMLYGISRKQLKESADMDWVDMLVTLLKESQEVDYGVVLGFDQVYDRKGNVLSKLNQMIVPADWVFKVCEENPGLLPCPGLHPYRLDALDELDRIAEKGAVLIKWLPPAQNIDAGDRGLIPFYDRLSQYKIPILVHTGTERTFASVTPEYIDVKRLRLPLERGVPIVAAHTATPSLGIGQPQQWEDIHQLIKEFPHFWAENSGLCNPGRFYNLPRLAKDPVIEERTLYGSDWPVPINAFYYLPWLGYKKVREIESIANLIDRDVAIKRAFGFSERTLTKANDVLANLDRWL